MIDETKPKLLVLIGPTAVGKTKMSIEIAKEFGCEIISGDSMQVYRGMDIGTAKISVEEMEGVPTISLTFTSPITLFGSRISRAKPKAHYGDHALGKLPFIVGGTGLYVESVCYGYQFSETGADEVFREEQFRYANEHGAEALHQKLAEVDPETAERLHPNDLRRVVRALEVYHMTGIPLSAQLAPQTKQSPYDLCLVGLTMDRQMLYNRIEERIDLMLSQGLVDEVAALMDKGFAPGLVSMQGLGYKEIVSYLSGEFSYEEAVVLLKRDTRRFAKRQLSWFRHMKDIEWVDVTDSGNFSANYQKSVL